MLLKGGRAVPQITVRTNKTCGHNDQKGRENK